MPYRAIIFDMGDIFFDATPWRRALTKHLQELDIDIDYPALCRRWEEKLTAVYLGRRPYWSAFREFMAELGLDRNEVENAENFAKRQAAAAEKRVLFDGVADTLARLKAQGVKLAVLSDTESPEPVVRRRLAEMGIEGNFDAVATSVDIGYVKPRREAFAAVLGRLNVPPDQAAFVGHDADELDGARRCGIRAIAYNCEPGTPADQFIAHFSELLDVVACRRCAMSLDISDEQRVALAMTGEAARLAEMPLGEPAEDVENLAAVATAAAVESKKPSMLFLVSSLVSGNLVSMMLRMVGGLLQAKCVLPAVLGTFSSMGLVLGYAPFLQLGVLNGINRELPYYVGKGDRRRVNELAAAAQSWALIVGDAVGSILLGVACWELIHSQWQLAAGWCTYAVLSFLLFYNTYYLQMTYRTGHDFARLAMSSVIESAVALALVGLVWMWNFYGICLRALLTALVSVVFLHYWRPVRVGPRWNWGHLKHLVKIGAPIFAVGQIYAWWIVLDLTLVVSCMGAEGMGLYNLVLVTGGALEVLPTAVGHVIYPRMAEQYGRSGRLSDLVRMSIKPTLLSVLGVVPLVVLGWLLAEPVTRFLLRNYVAAIPAIRWSLLAPLVACLFPVNNVYNVVKRQDLYVVAIVLGMGTYCGSLFWLLRNGVSSMPTATALAAFPQAMVVGRIVFIAACCLLMYFPLRKKPIAAR